MNDGVGFRHGTAAAVFSALRAAAPRVVAPRAANWLRHGTSPKSLAVLSNGRRKPETCSAAALALRLRFAPPLVPCLNPTPSFILNPLVEQSFAPHPRHLRNARRGISLAASLCFLSQAPQGALAAAHMVGRETEVARTGAGHCPSSVLPAAAPFSGVESISRSDVNPTEPVGLSILSMSKPSAAETSAASITLESTRCRAVAAATRSPLALASALRTESVEPRDPAVASLRRKRTRTSSCWHPAQDSRYDTPENGMMQCTESDSTDSETMAALQIKRRTRSSTSSG